MKYWIAMVLLLSGSVSAVEFKDYRVQISDDTFASLRLPVSKVEAYRAELALFAKNIASCTAGRQEAANPLLGKKIIYVIQPGEAGCGVSVNSYGTWLYQCRLTQAAREALSSSMTKRISDDAVLGDYSQDEKAVLFNRSFCESQRITAHK